MASVGYATLSVIPSAKGFGTALASDVDPQLDATGRTSGARFGRVLGSAAVAAAGLALAGISAVIKTGVDEAMDASGGIAQLEAGIKSTGGVAGVTVEHLTDMAGSLQLMSGQTDDSIVAAQQLLLTFTNIRNTGTAKIFDEATLAATDMAAKLGGDASSNATLLGKALNDPVNGLSALTRAGVQFTDDQKAVIQGLVDTGDVAGAQSIILAELNTQFGGAAEAAGKSLPGQLEIAKRKFEDISQTIAEKLIPVVLPALMSIADTVTEDILPAVAQFIQEFKDGTGPGGKFRDVLDKVGAVLSAVVGFVKDNIKWLGPLALAIGVVTAAVWLVNIAMAANPVSLIVIGIAALAAAFLWAYNNVSWFKTGIDAIGAAFVWLWDKILKPHIDIFVATWTWMWENVIKPVIDFIVAYFKLMGDTYLWVWDNVLYPTIQALSTAFTWVKDRIGENFALVRDIISGAADFIQDRWDKTIAFFREAPGKIGGFFSKIGDTITNVFKGAFNGVARMWNDSVGKLSFTIPDIVGVPNRGETFSFPKIPLLAEGGIVTKPTLAMVGEGPESEAVIPLSKLDAMLSGGGKSRSGMVVNITTNDPSLVVAEFLRMQRLQVA